MGAGAQFRRRNSEPVREFFITNAKYWIEEFHFDGLRLDATQQIFDESEVHVLIRDRPSRPRGRRRAHRFSRGGKRKPARPLGAADRPRRLGLDAIWNDDFHHSATVAAKRQIPSVLQRLIVEKAQELVSALKYGFLYQGPVVSLAKTAARPARIRSRSGKNFIIFLENHDQIFEFPARVARAPDDQSRSFPRLDRAPAASPCIPMLFQGQEFSASAPFL